MPLTNAGLFQSNRTISKQTTQVDIFTSRLRHGHRLGCDVVLVLLVLLGTFSFWSDFLERVELLGLGHLGKSQNSFESFKLFRISDYFQTFSDFRLFQTFSFVLTNFPFPFILLCCCKAPPEVYPTLSPGKSYPPMVPSVHGYHRQKVPLVHWYHRRKVPL